MWSGWFALFCDHCSGERKPLTGFKQSQWRKRSDGCRLCKSCMHKRELRRRSAGGTAGAGRVRAARSKAQQTFGLPRGMVRRGRVCYELTLDTVEDDVRVGWATSSFLRIEGRCTDALGDDGDCWAVDGKRKWHNNAPDGEPRDTATEWKAGDVIGAAADLTNNKSILFAKNGQWCTVFTDITADGVYPAFSSHRADYRVNFGANPFRYPPPDDTFVPVARVSGAEAVILRGAAGGATGGASELLRYVGNYSDGWANRTAYEELDPDGTYFGKPGLYITVPDLPVFVESGTGEM
eukprot:gene56753-biopygen95051